MKLGIIVGTVRQNRQTPKQAQWVAKTAAQMEGVEAEVIDLMDYPLPFFDEPVSPRYNPNREPSEAVKKWLDKLAEKDAYVFVTPEYNRSIPGVLKNAIDYLDFQLNRKPVAIAAHGTVGGAFAIQQLKIMLSESKAMPVSGFIAVPGMSSIIDDEGNLNEEAKANPYGPQTALDAVLKDLKWYSDVLAAARDEKLDA